ncbi:Pvc16 family protein [Ferruginibacter profundus]
MINQALEFTSTVLDQYLKNRFALDESKLQLNILIEPGGTIPPANKNKLVLSLINIEKESVRPFYTTKEKLPNGSYADVSISARFNLDILLSTSFDDYKEGLKFLDAAILFFQVNTFLDNKTNPEIPAGITKLEYDVEKLTYHQMHSLWTAMGAKYQPSIIYKIRMVTLRGAEVEGFTPAISGTLNEAIV